MLNKYEEKTGIYSAVHIAISLSFPSEYHFQRSLYEGLSPSSYEIPFIEARARKNQKKKRIRGEGDSATLK